MLDATDLLEHCLSKPGAWRDEPWDGEVVVEVGAGPGPGHDEGPAGRRALRVVQG